MIITRDIINKNIKFHDVIFQDNTLNIVSYDYNQLCTLIDSFKNLLQSLGAQPGQNAVIGEKLGIRQLALVFACSELAIEICIVNETGTVDHLSDQVRLQAPFDYLMIHKDIISSPKVEVLSTVTKQIIISDNHLSDSAPNNTIWSKPDSCFLSCSIYSPNVNAVYGANATLVKKFDHTFIYHLLQRNSKMFYGKAASMANLNHGSSPAAYFLPILLSELVTDYYHFPTEIMRHLMNSKLKESSNIPELHTIFEFLNKNNIHIEHINFPYTSFIDNFLTNNPKIENCILYTLSYIKTEWLEYIKNKNIKDIISIYGTSEVSGPVLINQASDIDFEQNKYKKIDNFYNINVSNEGILEVGVPYQNVVVSTGDYVDTVSENQYRLLGKKQRINDLYFKIESYKDMLINQFNIDATLLLDNIKNSIYMAIWDKNISEQTVQNFNMTMIKNSNNLHFISKYEFLDKEKVNSLDTYSLIEYFRNKK